MSYLYFYSENIGSRTLELLLAFDFATSSVYPLPSRQEQHPVVWKYDLSFPLYIYRDSTHARILNFRKPGTLVHDVTYTDLYVVHFCWLLKADLYNFFIGSHLPRPRGNHR